MLYLASCPSLWRNKKGHFCNFSKNVVHLKIIFTPNWTDPGARSIKISSHIFVKKQYRLIYSRKKLISSHIITPCMHISNQLYAYMYWYEQFMHSIDMIVYLAGRCDIHAWHSCPGQTQPAVDQLDLPVAQMHCISFQFLLADPYTTQLCDFWKSSGVDCGARTEIVWLGRVCVRAWDAGRTTLRVHGVRLANMATSCWSKHDEGKSTRRVGIFFVCIAFGSLDFATYTHVGYFIPC
jgi:hypothetical protein